MIAIRNPEAPASEAQLSFIRSLMESKEVVARDVLEARLAEGIDKGTASLYIEKLKGMPYKQQVPESAPSTPVSEPGIYEHDGKIFRVKWNKAHTNMYAQVATLTIGDAKRLTASGAEVNFDYVYAPGAFRLIDASHRITGARAEELAVIFTKCIVCNRRLKASTSVKAGIGPVCIKKV